MALVILLVGITLLAGGVLFVARQDASPVGNPDNAIVATGVGVSVAVAGLCAAVVGVLALLLG